MLRCPARLLLLVSLCCCWPALSAQQPLAEGSAEMTAHVATAIREWVAEFEKGRLSGKALVRRGTDLQPRYMAAARRAQLLTSNDEETITHLDSLQKMLFYAERYPSPELADAVLGIAAAGLETAFLDHEALELRELGHWSLHRVDAQSVWFLILRAAAGERVPLLSDLRANEVQKGEDGIGVGPARRVAALHLLGRKNWAVFKSTLEAALVDVDPRVRLAAAEAMAPPWRLDALRKAGGALANEHHPVVSQALVRLMLSMLRHPPKDLTAEVREIFVAGALAQFGRCGWRTDMDLLAIVEAFPHKAAIPTLIAALDLEVRTPDALVTAVNKRASPILRERAGTLLRAMTGAVLLADDAAVWREFWQREQKNIVVPERLPVQRENGTRAQFFGVPITGGSIAFLVDTSGSMEDAPAGGVQTGPRSRRREGSRLAAAKEQLLLAAQAMPSESQYYVLTFAGRGKTWTSSPIKPSANSLRSLTELLSRMHAHGSTNLFDGLALALQWQDRRYGEAASSRIDELFVLSDGEPTVGEVTDIDDLLQIVREANKYAKVRIHTVFTGTGSGADLLRRLAAENGGVFVQR